MSIKEKLENMAAKKVNDMVKAEAGGWPPVCLGMTYQPERPARIEEKEEK